MSANCSQWSFKSLSTFAVVFSCLNVLFGIYLVLFVLAIWGTYQHGGPVQSRLRWVTILLFVVLCVHYTARAITFAQSRGSDSNSADSKQASWIVSLTFVNDFTSTLSGTISDGLLAWRFYVLHDRSRWAFCVPLVAIVFNAMLGASGNFLYLSYFHSTAEYSGRIELVALQIYAAWGWCMLATNTLLSGAMIWRIMYISRPVRSMCSHQVARSQYKAVLEAIAESALVTWVGLAVYGISAVAPQGRVTTHWDAGFIMSCILPVFFGISQCLITARLGFAVERAAHSHLPSDRPHIGCTDSTCAQCNLSGNTRAMPPRKMMDIESFGSNDGIPEDERKVALDSRTPGSNVIALSESTSVMTVAV